MRCDGALVFERPELNALRDVWQTFAAADRLPRRSDFGARVLKPFLRNIMIVEREFTGPAQWRYKMRLEGTAMVEMIGESTGKYLDECYAPEFLPRLIAPYDAVLEQRVPMRVVVELKTPRLDYLTAESLIAPLANARGETAFALRCTYFRPKVAANEA